MGSIFSSDTLYKVVAVLETLFSVVIFAFGINTLFIFFNQNDAFQSDKEMIKYAAIVAIIHSIVQIMASIFLVVKSKNTENLYGADADPGSAPKFWLVYSIIQVGILLFIFFAPLNYCIGTYHTFVFRGGPDEVCTPYSEFPDETENWIHLRTSLNEMYTYVIANMLFKVLFIWIVYTTVRCGKRKSEKGKLALIDNDNYDNEA